MLPRRSARQLAAGLAELWFDCEGGQSCGWREERHEAAGFVSHLLELNLPQELHVRNSFILPKNTTVWYHFILGHHCMGFYRVLGWLFL